MFYQYVAVAPHAGAWIEIFDRDEAIDKVKVAPHAGAWIEILHYERINQPLTVAPHAGAWIEMETIPIRIQRICCRTSRRCVD